MKKISKKIKTSDTILGADAEFEGNMKFFGTFTIEGTFKGTIRGEGTVIVACDGNVRADIYASDVIIYGKVYGTVFAENRICVCNSAMIFGDIEAPVIQTERGAFIKGKCNTRKVDKPNEEELAIIDTVPQDVDNYYQIHNG